ncbi:MarC family protein [Polluticoccus soli]|uniref:MarC family protein n=1 Tax=Polluticoccus soli TaxID=3034150 RepID=UPI0023E3517D|nr:MarC family protein [Flavipsychrobacter sp. JY13-12]
MKHQHIFWAFGIFCLLVPIAGFAQAATAIAAGEPVSFSLDMVFTFLFLTLGPLKIIQPFWLLTKDRNAAFRRKLALSSSVIALIAAILAATIGAKILMKWHILPAAAALTAGILLFLIALKTVMQQYGSAKSEAPEKSDTQAPSVAQLAFSPLAFPTIVTPYGAALLIVMVTVSNGQMVEILSITAIIFGLNFLTMLVARRIMKWSPAVALLGILGSVMGVLQVALGVQTILKSLYILGLKV